VRPGVRRAGPPGQSPALTPGAAQRPLDSSTAGFGSAQLARWANGSGGRFVDTCQLLLSCSEPVCSVSGYRPMSPVSAPFWHAAGTTRSGCC
jgi:hypothetical protein